MRPANATNLDRKSGVAFIRCKAAPSLSISFRVVVVKSPA
jgi:hypothetical protein